MWVPCQVINRVRSLKGYILAYLSLLLPVDEVSLGFHIQMGLLKIALFIESKESGHDHGFDRNYHYRHTTFG